MRNVSLHKIKSNRVTANGVWSLSWRNYCFGHFHVSFSILGRCESYDKRTHATVIVWIMSSFIHLFIHSANLYSEITVCVERESGYSEKSVRISFIHLFSIAKCLRPLIDLTILRNWLGCVHLSRREWSVRSTSWGEIHFPSFCLLANTFIPFRFMFTVEHFSRSIASSLIYLDVETWINTFLWSREQFHNHQIK